MNYVKIEMKSDGVYHLFIQGDFIMKGTLDECLTKIEETCNSLSSYPNKGHIPPELERIGIYNYQEIHFEPYRIIYQVIEKEVYIHCILDSRRSLQELLEKRLLR